MKSLRILLAAAPLPAVLFVIFLAASPYLTLWRITQAADARDVQALSAYVDWPALRESLKAQAAARIAAEMDKGKDNPLAGIGRALAAGAAEKMIDALVTPENITLALASGQLLQGKAPGAQPAPQPAQKGGTQTYTARWQDWSHILVHRRGGRGGYILRRSAPFSWDWKLAGVKVE